LVEGRGIGESGDVDSFLWEKVVTKARLEKPVSKKRDGEGQEGKIQTSYSGKEKLHKGH